MNSQDRLPNRNRFYSGYLPLHLWLLATLCLSAQQSKTQGPEKLSSSGTITVIGKDGTVQPANPTEVPVELQGVLSDVVETFLRKSIESYEDKINPPKYSDLSYIEPGDNLGLIQKNATPRAVKPEDVPASVQKDLGEGTNPK